MSFSIPNTPPISKFAPPSADLGVGSTGGSSFPLQQPPQPNLFSAPQSQSLVSVQPASAFSFAQPSTNVPSLASCTAANPNQVLSSSNSLFNNPASSNQLFSSQTVPIQMPQISATPAPFPRDTKFSELPTDLKAGMEVLDRRITGNGAKLMTMPAAATRPKIPRFDGELQQIEALSDIRKEKLRELRRKLNQSWRYTESMAQALMASKSTLPDGRVTYAVPMVSLGLDTAILERSVEGMEEQVSVVSRMGEAAKNRLNLLVTPTKPVDEVLKASLKNQYLAIKRLGRNIDALEEQTEAERNKFKLFLQKYRSYFQDPFRFPSK